MEHGVRQGLSASQPQLMTLELTMPLTIEQADEEAKADRTGLFPKAQCAREGPAWEGRAWDLLVSSLLQLAGELFLHFFFFQTGYLIQGIVCMGVGRLRGNLRS